MIKYKIEYSQYRRAWVVVNLETGAGQSFWIKRLDAVNTTRMLNIVARMNKVKS